MWRPKWLLQLLDSLTRRLSLPPLSHLLVRLSFLSLRPVSLRLYESPPPQQGNAAALCHAQFHLGTGRWTLACHLAILLPFINLSNPIQHVIVVIVINTHPFVEFVSLWQQHANPVPVLQQSILAAADHNGHGQ